MSLIVTFFIAGIVMLALEVVLPGAVLGVFGGLSLFIGVGVAFSELGATGGGVAALLALALIALTLYLEFRFLPGSPIARMFTMGETVSGTSQPALAPKADVVGREVVAVTPLSPTGYVELAGSRYEAAVRNGHAERGERLTVVDVDNFRLILTKSSIQQPL
jgi:membrane-bound ClpP family serine protease